MILRGVLFLSAPHQEPNNYEDDDYDDGAYGQIVHWGQFSSGDLRKNSRLIYRDPHKCKIESHRSA